MDELLTVPEQENDLQIFLATVTEVTATGVKIQIDGEDTAGTKEYQCNTAQSFSVGDRVKIDQISGSFLIEYRVGPPGETYPLPTGGSAGQVLAKNSGTNYDVVWTTLYGLPSGGSAGQILVKSSSTNYDVAWKSAAVPSGGSAGQVLTKNTAINYDVKWATPTAENGLPTGGSSGQVLVKDSSTNYDASWGSISVSSLTNGNYTISLSSGGVLAAGSAQRKVTLGSSQIPFNGCYIDGNIYIGTTTSARLGFFGTTPQTRKSVSSSATVATLITALKGYGLFS